MSALSRTFHRIGLILGAALLSLPAGVGAQDRSSCSWRELQGAAGAGDTFAAAVYAPSERRWYFYGGLDTTDRPTAALDAIDLSGPNVETAKLTPVAASGERVPLFGAAGVGRTMTRQLLFVGGGDAQGVGSAIVQRFDAGAGTWDEVAVEGDLPGRLFHAVVYIAALDAALIVGGTRSCTSSTVDESSCDGVGDSHLLYFDPLRFEPLPPLAPGVVGHSLVVADEGERILLFGGVQTIREGESSRRRLSADLWQLSLGAPEAQWTPLTMSGGPSPRAFHGAAFDVDANEMIVHGGVSVDPASGEVLPLTDTWILDFNETPPRWRRVSLDVSYGGSPPQIAQLVLGAGFGTFLANVTPLGGELARPILTSAAAALARGVIEPPQSTLHWLHCGGSLRARGARIDLVSKSFDGTRSGNDPSANARVGLAGDPIVFESRARNLVALPATDTQVYVRHADGRVELVSLRHDGSGAGDARSSNPSISGGANVVAFESLATDLVPGFVDLNGRNEASIYLRDLSNEVTFLVSDPTVPARNPLLSRDGAVVVYEAKPLADPSPEEPWIVVRRSVASFGSGLGRGGVGSVGGPVVLSLDVNGQPLDGDTSLSDVSSDGNVVGMTTDAPVLPGDVDGASTAMIHIFEPGMVVPVSVRASDGAPVSGASSNVRISPDGARVAFESEANDILPGDDNGESDIFVYEIATQTWVAVSHAEAVGGTANGASRNPRFGAGDDIIFESQATDLVPGFIDGNTSLEWDVFLYDLARHRMQLVSEAAGGDGPISGNGNSTGGWVGADRRFAVFFSTSTDLVSDFVRGHPSNLPDLFVRDLPLGDTRVVNANRDGTASSNSPPVDPAIDAAATTIAFGSAATDLDDAGIDTDPLQDLFTYRFMPMSPDFNGDGVVDSADFLEMVAGIFTPSLEARSDLNADGEAGAADAVALVKLAR